MNRASFSLLTSVQDFGSQVLEILEGKALFAVRELQREGGEIIRLRAIDGKLYCLVGDSWVQ